MSAAADVVVEASMLSRFPFGGVARIYVEILPRMCDADPDLTLEVLVGESGRRTLREHPSIRYRSPLPVDPWLRPRRMWARTRAVARRAVCSAATKGDRDRLWHATYFTLPYRWRGPMVVTVYDLIHERFPHLLRGGDNDEVRRRKVLAVAAADRVIAISEATRKDVIAAYGLSPQAVVSVPLAAGEVFRVLDDRREGAVDHDTGPHALPAAGSFLLWVGTRAAYKEFARFTQALAAWRGGKGLDVVCVGPPLSRSEAVDLAALGLRDRVRVLSGLDDEAICRLFNRAAAFVYPSLYEGFGIPLLEAMACGCPLVAARIPTSLEVAGDCAVLFEPGDTEDMIEALATAVAEGRAADRVLRGRERAKLFSWDRTAHETLRVYRELAGGG